jgi:FKBP-type peptidyl-prolyl cis-trans isomerase
VSASYSGQLLSTGKVFDSSVTPIQFPLANLIVGWQIAFLKFKKGTRALIYIPSPLGYGATARTNIPANSILIFEVNFTDFQ